MSASARVQFILSDARRMPLEAGSVDLIVTSPPYGVGVKYPGGDVAPRLWPTFMRDWLSSAFGVAREDGGRLALNVPLDASYPRPRPLFCQAVTAAERAGWQYRATIIWRDDRVSKAKARGSVDSATSPHVITRAEMVALFSRGAWRRADKKRADSDLTRGEWLSWTNGWWDLDELQPLDGSVLHWDVRPESNAWERHPAPFPLEIPHRLVRLLSFPGDVVLDPFVGSGTTCVAAARLGRRVIGVDNHAGYLESSRRRLAALMTQDIVREEGMAG